MEDVPNVAEKARTVAAFVRNVKRHLVASEKNWHAINDWVNTVNALIIPRAWIGIDDNNRLHVTYVWKETSRDQLYGTSPTELHYAADYVWAYRPWLGTMTCMKSRVGQTGQTFQCNPPVEMLHSLNKEQ